jgi:hypothetical protein
MVSWFSRIFLSKLLFISLSIFLLSGCVPKIDNKFDSTLINAHNDSRFLTNDLKCPIVLQNKTIRIVGSFDEPKNQMAMETIAINADHSIKPIPIGYDGSWQEDIMETLRRNLSTACGTRFSDQLSAPSIELKFKKITSQILSIDQDSKTKDFNFVSLHSRYDFNTTTNYVIDAEIGGTLFTKPLIYEKGLQKKESAHQLALGTNYLLSISTRTELSRSVEFSVLPETYMLYAQKNVSVMDMRTVVLPIISNEMIIEYALYAPSGDVRSKKRLSLQTGEISKNGPTTTLNDPSDKALINMFAGTSMGGIWINSAIVGPYSWLLYDLTREIIENAN